MVNIRLPCVSVESNHYHKLLYPFIFNLRDHHNFTEGVSKVISQVWAIFWWDSCFQYSLPGSYSCRVAEFPVEFEKSGRLNDRYALKVVMGKKKEILRRNNFGVYYLCSKLYQSFMGQFLSEYELISYPQQWPLRPRRFEACVPAQISPSIQTSGNPLFRRFQDILQF